MRSRTFGRLLASINTFLKVPLTVVIVVINKRKKENLTGTMNHEFLVSISNINVRVRLKFEYTVLDLIAANYKALDLYSLDVPDYNFV